MMNFNECLSVNGIREACKLIHFGIDVLLNIAQEVIIALGFSTKSIGNLFSDVKVCDSGSTFELSEDDGFVWLSNNNGFFLYFMFISEES